MTCPGEAVEIETQMNAGPWLDTLPDGETLRNKIRGGNPSSGCPFVKGSDTMEQPPLSGSKTHDRLCGRRTGMGDMHALQGDGEICGAGGIESEGIVRIRCSLSEKPVGFASPRLESASHIMAVAMEKPAEEAFLIPGQVMEARCTQFVNPTYTYLAEENHQIFSGPPSSP